MATVEPSSGVLRASLPILVPSARGGAQPNLGLIYSSAAGLREAGMGWGLTTPIIERRGPGGSPPQYQGGDGPWHLRYPSYEPHLLDFYSKEVLRGFLAAQTRYTFNGEALVKVCGPPAPCTAEDGALPDWAAGWNFYRLEFDNTFHRFFLSPDGLTWRVQARGGEIMEFGRARTAPLPDPDRGGIDFDEQFGWLQLPAHPFRWNLVRRFDPASDGGTPRNTIIYRWEKLGDIGRGYLTDIYYTPPAGPQIDRIPTENYAHHIRLVWERPKQVRNAIPPIWRAPPDHHLIRIDVASKAKDAARPRELVRRHHLTYESRGHRSFLLHFQIEGRCETPIQELAEALPATNCPRLPAWNLRYEQMQENRNPHYVLSVPAVPLAPGTKKLEFVPFDVNADAIPDFIEAEAKSSHVTPNRRMLVHNGTWYVPDLINSSGRFTLLGHTVTGNFSFTGESSAWFYVPPAHRPEQYRTQPSTAVPRLGPDGWTWVDGVNLWTAFPDSKWRIKLVGDVDGDGLRDLLDFTDPNAPGGSHWPDEPYWHPWLNRPADWDKRAQIETSFGRRVAVGGNSQLSALPSEAGAVRFVPVTSCMGPSWTDMDGGWPDGSRPTRLADMNGDALDDIVVVGPTQIRYWPSDGRGNFTACRGAGCTCTTANSSAIWNSMLPHALAPGALSQAILLADLNGDGYADLVSWNRDQLRISFNRDGWFFRDPIVIPWYSISLEWAQAFDENAVALAVADMNGNGIQDLVITVRDEIQTLDLHRMVSVLSSFAPDAYASRPDLLIEIDNGLGARTQVAYESTADMANYRLLTGQPWPDPMPQVMHVVQRLTFKTDVPNAKPVSTYFEYDDPAWDGWERRFRGFRKVSSYEGVEPQVTTTRTFFIPRCPAQFCGSMEETFYRLRAVSGLPLTVEISDQAKRTLSTVSYSYQVRDHEKTEGRWIRSAYATQVDTRLYDVNDWDPINATSLQTISGVRGEPIWTGPVPIRARGSVLLRTTVEQDDYGNLVKLIEHGRIRSNGNAIDLPRVTSVVMEPPRPDWRFLPQQMWVDAFPSRPGLPTDHRRLTLYEHDTAGRLMSASALLTGTVPLDRRHEDPTAAVAPPPLGRSWDTLVLLARYTYDEFDNVTRTEAPAGSCTTTQYDEGFAQLPVIQAILPDGCAGAKKMEETIGWDRGLEAAVAAKDISGAQTRTVYDSFGRIAAVHLADPSTGAPSPEPSLAFAYFVAHGGPIQKTLLTQRTGPGAQTSSWLYSDGAGREVLRLRQADPAAGDEGAWIASGLSEVTAAGLVAGTQEPWFYSGDPASAPLAAPPGPKTAVVRDSFGRISSIRGPEESVLLRRVYRPLRIDSEDGLGRRTSVSVNGHGFLVLQLSGKDGDETGISIDYQVGGEPARIVQARRRASALEIFDPARPRGLVRWMQYDSLGRLVVNAEPNTAENFDADASSAGDLRAWRYAYDWAGRLVGASDARGCGWNVHLDRLGRKVARDFSPCLSSHTPYSWPDLMTGEGTEEFYVYDQPEPGQVLSAGAVATAFAGRLAASWDRAAHTRLSYDARGRPVQIERRVARPAAADAAWPALTLMGRYGSDWFRMERSYDDVGRTVRSTTGATAPALLDAAGKSEILLSYTARGLLKSVGGTYGILLDSTRFDASDRRLERRLGDLAGTQIESSYNAASGFLENMKAARMPAPAWAAGGPGYTPPGPDDAPSTQSVLEHRAYQFDAGGNLLRVDDLRAADDWPTGAKPVSRLFEYDASHRLKKVDYVYSGGPDPPVQALPTPPAISGSSNPARPLTQTFAFDIYGNMRESLDDANARFDRSLGGIGRGTRDAGPNQLTEAGDGSVVARHDAAGNLVSLQVSRNGCAAPPCSHRFDFDWDEVGQLARARRWDFSALSAGGAVYPELPAQPSAADLRYRYDAGGVRVLRTRFLSQGHASHSLWPLGPLRLDGAAFDANAGTYTRTNTTEQIDLPGLAHILVRPGLPGSAEQRVLLAIHDHLGSTTALIDKATGELVEQLTYLPYGKIESAYRPPRWSGLSARERFTGKEEDEEVGLTYFGARYLFPVLGQWISPDPLTIHGLGPDLNPYAYVSGQVTRLVDPFGLQACIGMEWYGACHGSTGGGSNGGVQIGFGKPGTDSPASAGHRSSPYHPWIPTAKNPASASWSGAAASAVQNGSSWYADSIDPRLINGFNQGVDRNAWALAGTGVTAAISSTLLAGMAIEVGGMIAAARASLTAFGRAIYVQAARAGIAFTNLSLAQQGISMGGMGGAGYGLSRSTRAQQIYGLATEELPYLHRSTIAVADLTRADGTSIRVISTNNDKVLAWLQRNLVLNEGELIVPIKGAAHAEIKAAQWGLANLFSRGSMATRSRGGCPDCTLTLGATDFVHDNPEFPLLEILSNPGFFFIH